MLVEGSLLCSQEPVTGPYPEPDEFSPHFSTPFPILILSSYLCLDLPSRIFPSDFPTKTLQAFLISSTRVTCPAHLSLFNFITLIIFGEANKL